MTNNKQTALQELIKELKQFKKFPMVDQPTIDAAIEFAELKLEMEKQQIIETARFYFHERGKATPEQYYNQEYGGEQ